MTDLKTVIGDLTIESEQIDRMVADIDDAHWRLPTPAPGWTVADQVAHLAFIFRLAGTAASDAAAFQALVEGAKDDFDGAVNAALAEFRALSPRELLARWRAERDAGIAALAAVPPDQTVPWLVNPLPPVILACAGIMETFAHGQDIADALDAAPERTDRLEHLVGFAALTRDFAYQARGVPAPEAEFRYEITLPSGRLLEIGPADAGQRVAGPAEDFCLLVTRRRHRDDLAVTATGAEAEHWLDIAQAYRGPAGAGRSPGQFSTTSA
ncbi:TIGR03084 family protein [Actinomadura sp. CNU-125]|uniref:TIGR03084 family metal-binding protein n=1 Tax=Actinomadura sp. CNU-125 TaxID=1904961 RepID=UPI000963B2EB|nr:TIGR03084 family metal-binding protein [Actinomadura sp. CNU-125]OLT19115.1 TIGR03084 family protein [Actinomadura sp. CNU-125]